MRTLLVMFALATVASAGNIEFGAIGSPVYYTAVVTSIKNPSYRQTARASASGNNFDQIGYGLASDVIFMSRRDHGTDDPILHSDCISDSDSTYTLPRTLRTFGYRYIALNRVEEASNLTHGIFDIYATDDLRMCSDLSKSRSSTDPGAFGFKKVGKLEMTYHSRVAHPRNPNF